MQALKHTAATIALLIALDVFILLASLAQLELEGTTGTWNGFWRWQAEQVVKLIK